MKKILVVSNMYPSPQDVAFGTFVRNTVECLEQNEKFEVVVVKKERTKNIYTSLVGYVRLYLKSFHELVTNNYDLCYVHYTSHSSLGVLAANLFRKKVKIISHVHGSDVVKEESVGELKFKIKKWISSAILNRSSLIFTPSRYYKNLITDEYFLNSELVHVSPSGGVDTEIFKPIKKNSQCKDEFVVGFVGRLTKDKGFCDFVELIDELGKSSQYKFVVVGDGPLKGVAEGLENKGIIKYFNKVDQKKLPEIYNMMSVFLFPTRRITESLGLVALEAMSCGVPVIAYDIAGPKEYIDNETNGYLSAVGDIGRLRECIESLKCLDENAYAHIQANAIATATRYSRTIVASEMKYKFEEVFCE